MLPRLYFYILHSVCQYTKGEISLNSIVKNQEVRDYAASRGIRLWRIAEALNMTDASFSRKLRRELNAEEKSRIIALIDELERVTA
jgi:hypothetical protein